DALDHLSRPRHPAGDCLRHHHLDVVSLGDAPRHGTRALHHHRDRLHDRDADHGGLRHPVHDGPGDGLVSDRLTAPAAGRGGVTRLHDAEAAGHPGLRGAVRPRGGGTRAGRTRVGRTRDGRYHRDALRHGPWDARPGRLRPLDHFGLRLPDRLLIGNLLNDLAVRGDRTGLLDLDLLHHLV